MDHIVKLFLVMVSFGLLGGVVNYINSYPAKDKKAPKPKRSDLVKSLVMGVAASFLVPVFLNTISSNIVRESETDPIKLVVFAGFCVIASASSKSFIRAISGKVMERVAKVEEGVQAVKTEIQPLILKHVEPDDTGRSNRNASHADTEAGGVIYGQVESSKLKVLQELSNSDYAFRTINGLARDANMEPELVRECLEDCVASGLAGTIDNGLGARFFITADGHALLRGNDGNNGKTEYEGDGIPQG